MITTEIHGFFQHKPKGLKRTPCEKQSVKSKGPHFVLHPPFSTICQNVVPPHARFPFRHGTMSWSFGSLWSMFKTTRFPCSGCGHNFLQLHRPSPFSIIKSTQTLKFLTTLPTIQFGLQEERLFPFILKVLIPT